MTPVDMPLTRPSYRIVLHRPTMPTLMDSKSDAGREDYEHRIRQRLGLSVSEYAILNIHKIVSRDFYFACQPLGF